MVAHHLATAVIAIVLLLGTFVFAVIVMRNFGRGLKNTSASVSHDSRRLTDSLCTPSDEKQERACPMGITAPTPSRHQCKSKPNEH
jgi:hypothetical protein